MQRKTVRFLPLAGPRNLPSFLGSSLNVGAMCAHQHEIRGPAELRIKRSLPFPRWSTASPSAWRRPSRTSASCRTPIWRRPRTRLSRTTAETTRWEVAARKSGRLRPANLLHQDARVRMGRPDGVQVSCGVWLCKLCGSLCEACIGLLMCCHAVFALPHKKSYLLPKVLIATVVLLCAGRRPVRSPGGAGAACACAVADRRGRERQAGTRCSQPSVRGDRPCLMSRMHAPWFCALNLLLAAKSGNCWWSCDHVSRTGIAAACMH